MDNGKSDMICGGRTLVIGATGFIGRYVAEASLAASELTYVLLRSISPVSPSKNRTISLLQEKGAIVILGSINDRHFLTRTLKDLKINVVISAVGGNNILDQLVLVEAIKEVTSVKRFVPSEFGHDIDRADPVEPGLTMYNDKRRVRRAVEAAGVSYTYICCNSIAAWPYHDNTHPADIYPPLDLFQIYGDGKVKAYFVDGKDIGKFTMKAVYDTRTVNKSVHFRPACNMLNINELASLWEEKIGRTLPRVTITEQDLLAAAKENMIPESIVASFTHDIFINGCQINYKIDESKDVEVSELYPDSSFRTMSECFDEYILALRRRLPEDIATTNSILEPFAITATCA